MDGPEAVVLVHGLWMRAPVFVLMKRWLRARGFAVHVFSYPTVWGGLDANAARLARFVAGIEAPLVHLLGHSLGGLVVLTLLANGRPPRLGRVVLMGSPVTGSHCARVLLGTPALAAIVGRSMRDWLADPRPQAPEGVHIGLIAGDRSFGMGRVIPGMPKPNDGVVALAETRLAGARDTIVLPVSHSQMLVSRRCAAQAAAFLREGRFAR